MESPEPMDQDELIDAQFQRAVDIVQGLPKTGPIQTAYEDKLEMYSLFKQATVGDVQSDRPAIWDVLGRAKWDAWQKQKGVDPKHAKWLYVQVLQKVLRRYSDRTVARDLVRELDSYPIDPSSLVDSFTSGHMDDDDDSSSVASDRPRPTPTATTAPVPIRTPSTRPTDGYFVQPPPVHEGDASGEETDEEERHDAVRPDLPTSQGASSGGHRPASSMSSQMRYRTPMAASLAFSPTPTMQSTNLPPQMVQTPQGQMLPQVQQPPPGPVHRYSTPSAFAPPHPAPIPAGSASSTGYPPSVVYTQLPMRTGSTGMQFDPYGGRGSVVGSTPTQRAPLERVIEATQTTLAALSERIDTLEASIQSRTPPHPGLVVSGRGGRSRVASPVGASSSYVPSNSDPPFDPQQMGPWSMIIVPLSSMLGSLKRFFHFLAYPPVPSRNTTRLIIIRRLVLDASFAIAVLAFIRAIWRSSGNRRREVTVALVGVWHALAGRSKRTARVLVDKAVQR